MSGQGLLNSVFSCSSAGAKRKLRQTRSLDPALIRNSATDLEEQRFQHLSSLSLFVHQDPSVHLDAETKSGKTSNTWDLWGPAQAPVTGTIFSPRRWLQKSAPQVDALDTFSYSVWRSGDNFMWRSECGRCFRLKPVSLQSLSEIERVRLQEVAFIRLLQDYSLGCQITIPKDTRKRKKSLRRKLDSLGKEKKDREYVPQAFGVPLQQVIANDRWLKLRQETREQKGQREAADLGPFLLHLAGRRANKREFYSSNSSLGSTSEMLNEGVIPSAPETAPPTRRRGGMSVDCITDLDDGQSRLLEALQLSLPAELLSKKEKNRDKKLSLNPIYRQVPRVVDCCCRHLEKNGLQTVGIFRVGSSKKRIRQLREEFDQGLEVALGSEHSVHDVAALLKEFFREMPDPLLTRELYNAFIHCALLEGEEQITVLQLLICLLPACNSDTLQCLLHFLSIVASHAEDTRDSQGQEVTGNKMTSLNLATIFGPNVLHKQKISDKEFSVQSSARAEDSTTIINIVQRMITSHEALFMIPPELQHEVLLSLLETDCDVVDYLLRRKASHWESPVTKPEEPFCLSERCSSSDSNKASSGEVSPYDNNSPTLSQWLQAEDESVRSNPVRRSRTGHSSAESFLSSPRPLTQTDEADCNKASMWGTWHATLKAGCHDHLRTGSDGNLSDYVFWSSSDTLHNNHSNTKKPVRRTQTSPAEVEVRPHPTVTRAHTSPLNDSLLNQPQASMATSPWQLRSITELHQSQDTRLFPSSCRTDDRPPPPYPGLPKASATFLQSSGTQHQLAPSSPPTNQEAVSQPPSRHTDIMNTETDEYQDWQRDKWQVWQLLSSDSVDSLPETLV